MDPRLLHKRALLEWRRLPEKKRGPDPQPVQKFVEATLREFGVAERMMEEEVVAAWSEIVGEFHARQARPIELKRGVLVIGVAHSSLLYELERFHSAEILRRMQERFGAKTIRKLQFRAGS